MGELTIRYMNKEDISQVLEIEKQCFSVPWTKEAFVMEVEKNKFARYIVAELDEIIVGYGGMWMVIDEAHVTNIGVRPDFRGRGFGDVIVKAMIAAAEKEGIYNMTLEVRASNRVARNLYEKYGFKACGIRPKYYQDNNEDAVIMWKQRN
ncbi:ribosomal protein S18-alanine N-acetyltransferase [Geosporobacter ferrireducens]|uniref:ribosomal protein S18-alanine N-acetyltransferase n=1 Tax=Geosporobacter ferrireducens TaxID=1424294 RepID=UPI002353CCC5|nr:ribosomal protein S18-alanine N-acetyltransferase [Geosporobacter ferrireducens]